MKAVSMRMISGNRGDLASRYGILAQLHELNVGDITVFCDDQSDVGSLPFHLMSYGPLFNLLFNRDGLKVLLSADCVLWTAGIDLQDDSSLLKLCHMFCAFLLYRLMGKKIFVLMQGAGPVTTMSGKLLVKMIVGLSSVFSVRDSGSLRLLNDITRHSPKLICCYDGIFCSSFQNIALNVTTHKDNKNEGNLKKIGYNVRLWYHFSNSILPYHFQKKKYKERAHSKMKMIVDSSIVLIKKIIESSNTKVVLVSMYEPDKMTWEDDMPFLLQIKNGFIDNSRVEIMEEPMNLRAFYTRISQLNLMIGMRLHATLLALRSGVPSININYTLKGRDIFNDMGLGDYVIELEQFIKDPLTVTGRIDDALYNKELKQSIDLFVKKASESNLSALKSIFKIKE